MSAVAPLDGYQKRLIGFLSVATFFEGYDFFAVAQILPTLRADFGLGKSEAGWLLAFINLGTLLASFLVRLADRWGRRRVLSLTIAGYTVCSLLTALSHTGPTFAVAQLGARIFLIGEWAIAMVMAAEEFPKERRGTVIGVIQACSSLGGIACAGVVPLLLKTDWGWRSVYAVGTVPLVLVALARRGIRETQRFSARDADAPRTRPLDLLFGPYRNRVIGLGLIWLLAYCCTQSATTFWKEFAVGERGFTDAQVGLSLTIAALGALPFLFLTGRLFDAIGRRRGGVVVFVAAMVGVVGAYMLQGRAELTVALAIAIFGTSAVLPLLNTYTAELFPTEARGDAFALANNVIGRIGYIGSPVLVGIAAEQFGWGPAVASTALFLGASLVLLLAMLPETQGKELEETAALH